MFKALVVDKIPDFAIDLRDKMTTEIALQEAPQAAADMLDGKISGCIVVRTSVFTRNEDNRIP